MIQVHGRLEKDAAWNGPVLLTGDLVVPEGVTLRLLDGARVETAEKPRWSCAVFRAAPEGWPIETSVRERCDLVVQGRLEAEGALLGGPAAWGGVVLLGRARARMTRTCLAGPAAFGVQAFDDSRAELAECDISADIGLWAWGLSRISTDGGIVRAGRWGGIACEGSRLQARGTRFTGGARGLISESWATVEARSCAFAGHQDGALLAKHHSWARLEDCSWKDEPPLAQRLDEAYVDID